MRLLGNLLTGFVAVCHMGILVLEMVFWDHPVGRRIFNTTPEVSGSSAVLAMHQGLYNGFLAAGLTWGLWAGRRTKPGISRLGQRRLAVFRSANPEALSCKPRDNRGVCGWLCRVDYRRMLLGLVGHRRRSLHATYFFESGRWNLRSQFSLTSVGT